MTDKGPRMVPNVAVWTSGVGMVRRGLLNSLSISLSRDSVNGSLGTGESETVLKGLLHRVDI